MPNLAFFSQGFSRLTTLGKLPSCQSYVEDSSVFTTPFS